MPAYRRLDMILDEGSFQEWNETMPEQNPMEYRGYPEKLAAMKARTGLDEAVVTGKGSIHGTETVIGVCDGRFLMASMGENVGEKILLFRRSQNAGGDYLADADGKDLCSVEASQ